MTHTFPVLIACKFHWVTLTYRCVERLKMACCEDETLFSLVTRAFRVSSRRCINHVEAEDSLSFVHVNQDTRMKKQTKPEVFLDHYLKMVGLWRKPVPRDGLSLFRAVSEQLFNTQLYHTNLYEACRIVFLHLGKDPEKDWTEDQVISILSKMYKREFLIYEAVGKPPLQATDNNYNQTILLCRTNDTQLDSVYPIDFQDSLAICQSVLYEMLYRDVFGLDQELTEAVSLIRDQNKNRFSLMSNRFDDMDSCMKKFQDLNVSPRERGSRRPIPPVPYRIAKALDPRIYRNVELDIWEEERREQMKESPEYKLRFALGDKCQVIIEGKHYHGLLQEISSSDNTVVVFIHELGEKRTVPIRSLKSPSRHNHHHLYPRTYKRKQDWLSLELNNRRTRYSDHTDNFPGQGVHSHYSTAVYSQQHSSIPHRGEVMSNVNCDYVGMDISPVQNLNNTNLHNQFPLTDNIQRFPPPSILHQQSEALNTSYINNSIVPTSTYSGPRLRVPYFDSLALKDINMNCFPSQDVSGQDLPEVNTLRFFYNLGVENFRTVNQGPMWTGSEMLPMVPPGGVMTQDQLNGNFIGQFAIPPPPFIQYATRPDQLKDQNENKINHTYCIAHVPFNSNNKVSNVSPPVSDGNSKSSSSEPSSSSPSKSGSSQSDSRCDVSLDSNDSGCDSDSTSGSAQCNGSVKELESEINTEDLEKKLDNYIAKAHDNDTTSCVAYTPEFQVPNRPKSKKKYYMYGNLKLVKPIKDIPPKFLSKLSSLSLEKSRCEGEPIIIPFLPPKPYRKYHNKTTNGVANENTVNTTGHGFNPEAKCFVPGGDSVMHDPSIVACSSQNPGVQYIPYGPQSVTPAGVKPDPNTMYPTYYPTYIPSNNTAANSSTGNMGNPSTLSNSHIYTTTNCTGDGFKYSMHPLSTGPQQYMYPASYPVYYQAANGSYVDGSQSYYPAPAMTVGQGSYQAQYCSVQPQVNNAMQTS